MKRDKLYCILSAAALLVIILMFFCLLYLMGTELEDHWKYLVTTGSHASYFRAFFTNPKILACLTAVAGTVIAAVISDEKAIRREERGALFLLILVCLTLLSFSFFFYVLLKAL